MNMKSKKIKELHKNYAVLLFSFLNYVENTSKLSYNLEKEVFITSSYLNSERPLKMPEKHFKCETELVVMIPRNRVLEL